VNLLDEQLALARSWELYAVADRARMVRALRTQRRADKLQRKARQAFQRAQSAVALLTA
jgi:hypothetical protein